MKLNSTSIQVTWGEVSCMQRNGNITDYRMIYSTHEADKDVIITVTNQYILVLNGLYPLTEYTFKVAAIKNHEIGPYSINSTETSSPNSEI